MGGHGGGGEVQGEELGGGVRVPVHRGDGTGVGPAEQEGVALLGGGVTWTRARRRDGCKTTTTQQQQQLISQLETKQN